MSLSAHLAFDLGAESGRVILGELTGGRLSIREIHRFPTEILTVRGHKYWNIYRIFDECKKGLTKCAHIRIPDTIGFDTWGVDFCLLSASGTIAGLPYSYRDSRTIGAMESFFKKIPREDVYRMTGNQIMPINTLFQLESMVQEQSKELSQANSILFIADMLHYMFTGIKKTELTLATTSQLFNPITRNWENKLVSALGLKSSLFQDIVTPATILGTLAGEIADETKLPKVPLVAVATHDTSSAIAAVPAGDKNYAYISSGTWSLLGIEIDEPAINERSFSFNFANEGGVGGRWNLLKNIPGLWLIQQCKKIFSSSEPSLSYETLANEARLVKTATALIDPDYPDFLSPDSMPDAIANYCRRTGQNPPESRGEFCRCILQSLAFKYRLVIEHLRDLNIHPIECIHIIGGGSKNELLCQLTANATALPVIAGPAEITSIGNLLIQAKALGRITTWDDLREIVKNSFETILYQPRTNRRQEDEVYAIFQELSGNR